MALDRIGVIMDAKARFYLLRAQSSPFKLATFQQNAPPTDQLFDWHEFAMPTAARKRHVVVDYGLQLGHASIIQTND